MWLYFDLYLGYNLFLGRYSTITIIAENEFDPINVSPRYKDLNNMVGIFKPALRFDQGLDFGDIYVEGCVPITYMQFYKEADTEFGLDITAGLDSNFGLGLKVKAYSMLKPSDGYQGLDVTVSYETGPLYCELLAEIPKDLEYGVALIPELRFSFGNFKVYGNCRFDGVGADDGEIMISPAIGVKFSF